MAYVCTHIEEIRSDLRSRVSGDDTSLEELLAAARADGDVAGPLDGLHAILQAANEDARGLYGCVRGISPLGIDRARPGETVYLCPADRCVRYWWPGTPGPVPRCEISGEALRRDRL
ncbi:hypothetical protein OG266_38445 [Streptomyces sp. NBC_00554]|uniref:hypothetical protein n=1 Tax=Streptomyces sp. NBC_00554 TaxID=2903661 RepID=UPI00352ED2D8|nr:hypothetical protein OG266_38445 [Streptomyces sp. NBC_00554]